MSNTKLSNSNGSLTVFALILVPIVVLFCCLFLAIGCSEYWSHLRRYRQQQRHKRNRSDDSAKKTVVSDGDIELQRPMENYPPQPEPLRIVKARPVSKIGIGAAFCYPRIPRRRSSLFAVSRSCSGQSVTSMRSSSFTDGMDRLHVSKTRVDPSTRFQPSSNDADYVNDIAEVNDLGLSKQNSRIRTRSRILPWLRAISPRYWMASLRTASGRSANISTEIHPSAVFSRPSATPDGRATSDSKRSDDCEGPLFVHSRQVSLESEDSSSSAPRSVPIAAVNLKALAESPRVRARSLSMWATVDAYVDVNPLEPFDFGYTVPLDIIVILDHLPMASTETLNKAIMGCTAVVSSLDLEIDRFAIGYLDGNAKGDLSVLLPLGLNSIESAQRAMDDFQLAQSTRERFGKPDICNAIYGAANMLCCSEETSPGHIVFITTSPGRQFSTPPIDERISVHTMSPDCRFHFENREVPRGWHIFSDTDCYGEGSAKDILQGKVRKVVRHLRTGVDPGVITDLGLSLIGQSRSEIRSIWEETRVPILRPGERWVVPVQINVPAAGKETSKDGEPPRTSSPHLIENLMNQLHEMLGDFSHEEVAQDIMTASLEYKHSLLGVQSTVKLESTCKVVRNLRRCCPVKTGFGVPLLDRYTENEPEEEEGYSDGEEEEEEEYDEEEGYEGEEEDEGDDYGEDEREGDENDYDEYEMSDAE